MTKILVDMNLVYVKSNEISPNFVGLFRIYELYKNQCRTLRQQNSTFTKMFTK